MAEVKICGLKDAASLDAALAGGARYVGFVLHAKSPRLIKLEAAQPLFERARGRAETVAVVSDAPFDRLRLVCDALKPDWIQAHGSEIPAQLAEFRPLARKGVIKALGVSRSEDLAAVAAFSPVADMLLFDAKPPTGAERAGGHGVAFDWNILKGRVFPKPWFLSGGLKPENVAGAIVLSGADRVDVSSGVESAPGIKDPTRIAAFLAAAKAAQS
ncbi:MAG TPA: phosphoribosylanthranilate isomerase [Caulobacterales bacterium]|nr:phosphoribosylanthranilate isomerase [Caulobacterales bacterium]